MILLAIFEILLYGTIINNFMHWFHKHNVNGESIFCFIGHLHEYFQMVTKKRTFMDLHLSKFHHRHYESRILGMFHFWTPVLVLRDPELIQQMLVRDMDCFAARHKTLPKGLDPFWDANIFALESAEWRQMRSRLAPGFSQKNIKKMYDLMTRTALGYVEHMEENQTKEFNTKDTFKKYGCEVIANVILGLNNNDHKEVLKKNQEILNKIGNKLCIVHSFWESLAVNVSQLWPLFGKMIGVKQFDPEASDMFLEMIREEIKLRQGNNEERKDMLDLLINHNSHEHQDGAGEDEVDVGFARAPELPPEETENDIIDYQKAKQTKLELTHLDITAQMMFFFTSSYDTVSTALSFLYYELSRHNKIQMLLKEEIRGLVKKYDDISQVTYEDICGLEFMDQVVCESLRKWPPALFTDRKTVSTYHIPKTMDSIDAHPHEPEVWLEPGDVVVVPIVALHRSPRYFEQPKVFDPSRFSKKNRDKIKPYTYMPFGVGGRNCLGSRFALMQIKVTVFHLLAKYRLHMTKRTRLHLVKGSYNLDSVDGIWLGLEK